MRSSRRARSPQACRRHASAPAGFRIAGARQGRFTFVARMHLLQKCTKPRLRYRKTHETYQGADPFFKKSLQRSKLMQGRFTFVARMHLLQKCTKPRLRYRKTHETYQGADPFFKKSLQRSKLMDIASNHVDYLAYLYLSLLRIWYVSWVLRVSKWALVHYGGMRRAGASSAQSFRHLSRQVRARELRR